MVLSFDICEHKIRQVVIEAAKQIRKAKGLPEEKNITVLFNEAAPLLGILPKRMTSAQAAKLPAPHEMIDEKTGELIIPRKDCPECGQKESMSLFPLCTACTDAEGGKYKTKWECSKCGYKKRSGKVLVQWLDEMKIEWKPGMKADMGIKTATDQGLK